MSYNTRRTGGAQSGSGRSGTTQVNYHQQPAKPGNAAQSRYNTTSQAGYNTAPGYNTQSQPAFTTQPPTPAQPKPQLPSSGAQLPSSTTPASTPKQQPPVQSATPQQTPPAVKAEPLTPATTPQNAASSATDSEMSFTPGSATENGGDAPVRFWRKRSGGIKLSSKEKRARQNAKLRKVLNPKNSITFLNELRPGGIKFVVREEGGWGFRASIDIDGKSFSGNGCTVNQAKIDASEQVLKYLLLTQLSKPKPIKTGKDNQDNEQKEQESMETDSKDEDGEPNVKKMKIEEEEDSVPWGSLAAFALHKLFDEWQREGITEWERQSKEVPQPEKFRGEGPEPEHFPPRRPPGPLDEYGLPPARRFLPYPPRGRGFGPFPGPRGPPPPNFRMPRMLGPPPAATFLGKPFPLLLGNNSGMQPMKMLPEDANQRHPTMLLNQLKPNVSYSETREEDDSREVTFKITVLVDGKEYVGRGRSKKEAKKRAAKAALTTMGVTYPNDD